MILSERQKFLLKAILSEHVESIKTLAQNAEEKKAINTEIAEVKTILSQI